MEINHIFIFSPHQGREGDELVNAGFKEGSHRIHKGQGTQNRKFYVENFFLEIIWVINTDEITNEVSAPSGLWERANHSRNSYSPFGLCLSYTNDVDRLFNNCIRYQPDFLPEGMAFEVLANKDRPYLPWTCRLPFAIPAQSPEEPVHHQIGIRKLTKVIFGIPATDFQCEFTDFFKNESKIVFEHAKNHWLTFEFDNKTKGNSRIFKDIPLTVKF